MKNPTLEVLSEAYDAYVAGAKIKEVLALEFAGEDGEPDTLTYSQFWYFQQSMELTDDQRIVGSLDDAEVMVAVATARNEGDSWGRIAVRCQKPENAIRNAFKAATGLRSQGLRVGKGGRWFLNDQELYAGDLVKPGTAIPADTPLANVHALAVNYHQHLVELPKDELLRRCRLLGIKVSEKAGRGVIAKKLAEATAPKVKANA